LLALLMAGLPALSLAVNAPEPAYDRVLCVGDVVWKVPKPDIKNYGVEIFVLPDFANENDYKQYLYKAITDTFDFYRLVVEPGTYKFVAKYFNFKKEVRTVCFTMAIKNNKHIKILPTIEIGNK